jgi:[acyl-carrier-protein] S-malonyltransferase
LLALLFPGQGSQEVGMGRDVCEASAEARAVFERADAALGLPLSKLCFEGPEEELRRTEITQPALLTTCIALLRALEAKGAPLAPDYLLGHSLGEYTALVAAGALAFEDAVKLVHARGRFMQEAVPVGEGAMAAVLGIKSEAVAEACRAAARETGAIVSPANLNAPEQTVIAGATAAVERAGALAKEAGARRTVTLPVSAPFHCALMQPAAEKLAFELARVKFSAPAPPVLSNVEAEPNVDPTRIPALLAAQVTAPVRFVECVQKLAQLGVERVVEIGPGGVLTGLVARIDRRLARERVGSWSELEALAAAASQS